MMLAGEILNFVRFILNETDNQGRYSDQQALLYGVNPAMRAISLSVRFPEFQMTATSVAGQREYTLPEVISVKRVYVAGQPCPLTSIPTLEGDQIELYDQTAPNQQPQWLSAPNATYPIASDSGYPAPRTLPYYQGMRPMYYLRGQSVLGIQPPPASAYTIQVEGIAFPAPVATPQDQTIYPHQYLNALAWEAVRVLAASGVDNTELYELALREQYGTPGNPQHKGHLADLRDWLQSFVRAQPIQPLTYRAMWDPMTYRRRPF